MLSNVKKIASLLYKAGGGIRRTAKPLYQGAGRISGKEMYGPPIPFGHGTKRTAKAFGEYAKQKLGGIVRKSATGAMGVRRVSGLIAEYGTKATYLTAFAPFAAVGYPIMKVGGLGVKGGWAAAKGLGKATLSTAARSVSTPGRRLTTLASAAALGTGLAAGGQLGSHADRIRNVQRDPANTMGLSQSLYYAYQRR